MAQRADSAGSKTPSSPIGATLSTDYVSRSQTVTVIDVEDLREFQYSMSEEFWTFTISQFFVAGSFWLGLERFLTLNDPGKDAVFLTCVVTLVLGIVVGTVGYRQLNRRKNKIGRIIHAAEKATVATAATPSPPRPQGTVTRIQP